jgi:hypothetical protein
LWCAAGSSATAAPKSKVAGDLYLLTVTVGTHDPKGTPDDWNYTAVELEQVVKAHCGPLFREVKSNRVKGSQATHDGMLHGLDWLQKNVREQDLAFIYIGSHGGTDAAHGFCLYANGGNVYGDEIKPVLSKVKGKVVLVIQACCAGEILVKHKNDLEAMPHNVAAVCACKGSQHSHGVMLPPIMEGLCGWADVDKDGVVTVDEFLHYVKHRIGDFYPGKFTKTQEAVTSEPKEFDLSLPLAKSVPAHQFGREVVMAEFKTDWYGGVVLPKKDPTSKGRLWVHCFGDQDSEDTWVEKERVCPLGAEPVVVKSGNKWYAAALLQKDGDDFHVRYIGALSNKEETVARDRIEAFSLFTSSGTAAAKKGKKDH